MNITIVCVGKIKEAFYKDAVNEYAKRLSRYCKFQVIEVADEKTPDQTTEHEEDLIRQKEAEQGSFYKLIKNVSFGNMYRI